MSDPVFENKHTNPLPSLVGLRLEVEEIRDEFDLKCRLIFGTMDFEFKEHEYSVNIAKAYLRLLPEGCETTLGSAYGDEQMASVDETSLFESDVGGALNANVGMSPSDASAGIDCGVNLNAQKKQTRTQSRTLLPVSHRPNDSWEIRSRDVKESKKAVLQGTAIPDAKLCTLRKKEGGNRMAVAGEVHVSKSSIRVSARKGNRLGKVLQERVNKDAIVGQILKVAIQREISVNGMNRSPSTVAVSRSEVSEV